MSEITIKITSRTSVSRGVENGGGQLLVPFESKAFSKCATQPMTATER